MRDEKVRRMFGGKMKKARTALTVAGSDTCGGAGIQADIKVFEEFGVYAMSVITALTAQNTFSVSCIMKIPENFFRAQMRTLLEDIRPDAFKTGMIASPFIARETARFAAEYSLKNLVCDPVMISKSGAELCGRSAAMAVKKNILPLASVLTPNIPEAEFLCGIKILNEKDAFAACRALSAMGPKSILLKGGHGEGLILRDYYYEDEKFLVFKRKRIKTRNTHGTGCTLSSAITSLLALGKKRREAVSLALEYVYGAIKNAMPLGSGCGPLCHFYLRKK